MLRRLGSVLSIIAASYALRPSFKITGIKELAGAKLQILDSKDKVVDEWVTDGKAHELNGRLIAGASYTLHEVSAPAGYILASDVPFTVKADGSVTKVSMTDGTTKVSISKYDIMRELGSDVAFRVK